MSSSNSASKSSSSVAALRAGFEKSPAKKTPATIKTQHTQKERDDPTKDGTQTAAHQRRQKAATASSSSSSSNKSPTPSTQANTPPMKALSHSLLTNNTVSVSVTASSGGMRSFSVSGGGVASSDPAHGSAVMSAGSEAPKHIPVMQTRKKGTAAATLSNGSDNEDAAPFEDSKVKKPLKVRADNDLPQNFIRHVCHVGGSLDFGIAASEEWTFVHSDLPAVVKYWNERNGVDNVEGLLTQLKRDLQHQPLRFDSGHVFHSCSTFPIPSHATEKTEAKHGVEEKKQASSPSRQWSDLFRHSILLSNAHSFSSIPLSDEHTAVHIDSLFTVLHPQKTFRPAELKRMYKFFEEACRPQSSTIHSAAKSTPSIIVLLQRGKLSHLATRLNASPIKSLSAVIIAGVGAVFRADPLLFPSSQQPSHHYFPVRLPLLPDDGAQLLCQLAVSRSLALAPNASLTVSDSFHSFLQLLRSQVEWEVYEQKPHSTSSTNNDELKELESAKNVGGRKGPKGTPKAEHSGSASFSVKSATVEEEKTSAAVEVQNDASGKRSASASSSKKWQKKAEQDSNAQVPASAPNAATDASHATSAADQNGTLAK